MQVCTHSHIHTHTHTHTHITIKFFRTLEIKKRLSAKKKIYIYIYIFYDLALYRKGMLFPVPHHYQDNIPKDLAQFQQKELERFFQGVGAGHKTLFRFLWFSFSFANGSSSLAL